MALDRIINGDSANLDYLGLEIMFFGCGPANVASIVETARQGHYTIVNNLINKALRRVLTINDLIFPWLKDGKIAEVVFEVILALSIALNDRPRIQFLAQIMLDSGYDGYLLNRIDHFGTEMIDLSSTGNNDDVDNYVSFGDLAECIAEDRNNRSQVIKSYSLHPARFSEPESIANFIKYLIVEAGYILGEEDCDVALEGIISRLSLSRAELREIIKRDDFEHGWDIVRSLRRIKSIVGTLPQVNSEIDFVDAVVASLLGNNWEEDKVLVESFQLFTRQYVASNFGITLSSGIATIRESIVGPKHKRSTIEEDKSILEKAARARLSDPTAGWSFFYDRGNNQLEKLDPADFNRFFHDKGLLVSGVEIWKKIRNLFLLNIVAQHARSGKIIVGKNYYGYRKLKIRDVRIFWRFDMAKQELYFFAVNRRDAYKD